MWYTFKGGRQQRTLMDHVFGKLAMGVSPPLMISELKC